MTKSIKSKSNLPDPIQFLKTKLIEANISEQIAGIYIYGSFLKGNLRKESDIDIAILPSYNVDDSMRLQLISRIESFFMTLFKEMGIEREFSVLDMKGKYVSFELLYKIITEGILLFEKDRTERLEFENAVKRDYFDFIPFLKDLRKRKYGTLSEKT